MYRGLVYSNINISNTFARSITVDSSASASGALVPHSMWPENNLIIVDSVDDLAVKELLPLEPRLPNRIVSPNASKPMTNPSATEIRKAVTRRRRQRR